MSLTCPKCEGDDQLYEVVVRREARPVFVEEVNGQPWTVSKPDADGWTLGASNDGFYCGRCRVTIAFTQ